jgi:hypothetical protein
LESTQSGAVLPEEQATARLAVEAVSRSQKRSSGPSCAHEIDRSETEPAAPVDRQTGGLVEDETVFVFVEDPFFDPARVEYGGSAWRASEKRRETDPVAVPDPRGGRNASSVQAYLTGSEQTINLAPGASAIEAHEEIVDSLTVVVPDDDIRPASHLARFLAHSRPSTRVLGSIPLTSKTTCSGSSHEPIVSASSAR